ncbi:MAG: hypothetical protein ABEJ73_08800 [Haloplanus sp.]
MRALHRATVAVVGSALLATPAAAHGVRTAATGLPLPVVIAGVVGTSLLGGGFVLAAYDCLQRPAGHRAVVPVLVFALSSAALGLAVTRAAATTLVGTVVGVGIVYLGRDATVTACGACADATLGAVTLHRGLEGAVLATVYAADAALGLAGALLVAGHAVAETAAVGSLYAATGRRYALGAVLIVQAGFVLGVVAGWRVVDAVPATVQAGLLALVGGVLLAVGAREARRRYAVPSPTPA